MGTDKVTIRWQWLPLLLVGVGVVLVWIGAFVARDELGSAQCAIYAGGALALLSVPWLCRRVTAAERESDLASAEIARQQRQLVKLQRQAEVLLRDASIRLDRREQDLARRLITYHQWLELPPSLDLTESPSHVASDELAELAKKDRQMLELLEEESEQLFEKIRRNDYSIDGEFQPLQVRDDAYQLIRRVARIYRPDAEQPILETSVAQILHAASGACLHFLAVLDRLPLDVKQYNLSSIYGYIRQAVLGYGAYKTVAPYLPYANAVYRAGRVAMGASPVSVGAWWLGTELAKRGASSLATRLVNRQAIILLHDLVRVVGFEVANIYGGDFRHRDANWVYGAELTELISRYPVTPDSLSRGLNEVSALQLRSEYDRIYLYRLLAEHRSANPERFRAAAFLTGRERQKVASRLERFADALDLAQDPTKRQAWKADVEQRLHVKIKLADQRERLSSDAQRSSAIRSLAGFLVEVKQSEPDELLSKLATAHVLEELQPDARRCQLEEMISNCPFFFEQPVLEPDGEMAQLYLQDLVRLAVGTPPRDNVTDEIVVESGTYLRRDQKTVVQLLDRQYVDRLKERFQHGFLPRRIDAEVARAVLGMIESEAVPRFLYRDVTVRTPPSTGRRDPIWLLGTDQGVYAFSLAEQPKLLWHGDANFDVQCGGGVLNRHCVVSGGTWLDAELDQAVLVLPAPALGSAEKFYQPLLSLCTPSSRATNDRAR